MRQADAFPRRIVKRYRAGAGHVLLNELPIVIKVQVKPIARWRDVPGGSVGEKESAAKKEGETENASPYAAFRHVQ
jgi:hypothetical protein